MLSGFTGCERIQPRKISCTSCRVAVVLREPAMAWERETLCPSLSKAELRPLISTATLDKTRETRTYATSSSDGEMQWNSPAILPGEK